MNIGIQVSSLKPLLLTEEQVQQAFLKMKALGCNVVQLQWIDPSVSIDSITQALRDNGIDSVSVQDYYESVLQNLNTIPS